MKLNDLASEAHLKVLGFFLDNPNSIDTPRGVSAWTNLSRTEVTTILEEFTKRGILKAFRSSSTAGYALTENQKILTDLRRHAKRQHS